MADIMANNMIKLKINSNLVAFSFVASLNFGWRSHGNNFGDFW